MVTRELHSYATQRANPRHGSGMASVDVHAWLMTAALVFLLHDENPFGHNEQAHKSEMVKVVGADKMNPGNMDLARR